MASSRPPFRADQVGGLLRPADLIKARERYQKGEIDRAVLTEVEDRSIAAGSTRPPPTSTWTRSASVRNAASPASTKAPP